MKILVLSDFHVGRGKFHENGDLNILEDFDEDEKFLEFLDFYSTGTNYFTETHLILNGDILNLIQLDVNGVYTHLLQEEHFEKMVDDIMIGHPVFTNALRKFLSRPNKKLYYIVGNHDFGMIFPKAQEKFKQHLDSEDVVFTDTYDNFGVWVEHGHRFEPINTVPRSKQLVQSSDGQTYLNLPWASLFCLYLLPKLKELRPHIDKMRPLSMYVRWVFLHDFKFFLYLAYTVIKYLIRTQFPPYGKVNKNFRISLKTLSKIAIHPKYVNNAKRILSHRSHVRVVVMGHTHISEWRRFADGRLYFNCGTWNHVPSMDQAQHQNISKLTYVAIDVNDKKRKVINAYLNIWNGKWRPYKEEVMSSTQFPIN